jgi:hypothetical protein
LEFDYYPGRAFLFVETKPYQLYNNFSEGMSQLGGSAIGVFHDSIPPIA